jgi:hypothetical protein
MGTLYDNKLYHDSISTRGLFILLQQWLLGLFNSIQQPLGVYLALKAANNTVSSLFLR